MLLRTFQAGVLRSAMDESGSTMSPTMPSSARASSATSRSSSKEPEHCRCHGTLLMLCYGTREAHTHRHTGRHRGKDTSQPRQPHGGSVG